MDAAGLGLGSLKTRSIAIAQLVRRNACDGGRTLKSKNSYENLQYNRSALNYSCYTTRIKTQNEAFNRRPKNRFRECKYRSWKVTKASTRPRPEANCSRCAHGQQDHPNGEESLQTIVLFLECTRGGGSGGTEAWVVSRACKWLHWKVGI